MFGKLITAMATPFDNEAKLDLKETTVLVENLEETMTDTILLCGTTGESPTLSKNEKIKLLEHVLEVKDSKTKIMMGVGSNNTQATIEFVKEIDDLGADGYLVVVPYYNRPSQKGLIEHFKLVAKATTKPIIIYNIPKRCGIGLELDSIIELSKVENIIGIKEASGDIEFFKEIIDNTDDFLCYIGDDFLLFDSLKVGGDGIVSVASHIYGRIIKYILLTYDKDVVTAQKIFDIYKNKFKALFIYPNPVPVKEVLHKLNIINNKVRLPLINLDDQEKSELYRKLGL